MSNLEKWCKAILQEEADKMSIGSVRTIQLIKQEFERLQKENIDLQKGRDKLEAEICRLEMIWETERGDNNRLKKENTNYKNYTLKAIGYKERIIELESAFAGSEEMVKDKIKKISELEKAICLLTEVVDEQQQRLNNYDL